MSDPARDAGDAGDDGPGWRAQLCIGAALLAIAAVLAFAALKLPPPSIVGVGPSAAMRLVAAFVALLGIAHAIAAWKQRASVRAGEASESHGAYGNRASLAWVLGGLLGLIAILQLGGGFVLASTWLFVGTSRGFGERIAPRSIVAGLALTSLVYLFFTRTLSLALPAGPLERLFG